MEQLRLINPEDFNLDKTPSSNVIAGQMKFNLTRAVEKFITTNLSPEEFIRPEDQALNQIK